MHRGRCLWHSDRSPLPSGNIKSFPYYIRKKSWPRWNMAWKQVSFTSMLHSILWQKCGWRLRLSIADILVYDATYPAPAINSRLKAIRDGPSSMRVAQRYLNTGKESLASMMSIGFANSTTDWGRPNGKRRLAHGRWSWKTSLQAK